MEGDNIKERGNEKREKREKIFRNARMEDRKNGFREGGKKHKEREVTGSEK